MTSFITSVYRERAKSIGCIGSDAGRSEDTLSAWGDPPAERWLLRASKARPHSFAYRTRGRLAGCSALYAKPLRKDVKAPSRVICLARCTAHSSFCSSRIAPTRRTIASSFGKIPTTSVRRLISPLRRSIGSSSPSTAHVRRDSRVQPRVNRPFGWRSDRWRLAYMTFPKGASRQAPKRSAR